MLTNKSYLTKKEANTIDLPDCPADSISCICFNPENTLCAASSWDGTIKVFRIPYYSNPGSTFTLEKSYNLNKPVLCCTFFNNNIFAGLVDGSLVAAESNQTIKGHESSIKSLINFNNQLLISGSFDSTIKFWDLKSNNPCHSISLPGKVYGMDIKESFLVVAVSDRSVYAYDMNNINSPQVFPTKFNYSIRSISCHKDLDSFSVGGVEAKVETFSRSMPSKKLAFRCHRVESKLYAVNVIDFYPNNSGIIVSGGSDGSLVWFDKVNRTKMCTNEFGSPVTAGKFSSDGKYFVFATGDDWSKGYTGVAIKPSLKMIITSSVPGITAK